MEKVSSLAFDPYDIWATNVGLRIRRRFYSGSLFGKPLAIAIYICDWHMPLAIRRIIGIKGRVYPIVLAHEVALLAQQGGLQREVAEKSFNTLCSVAVKSENEQTYSWGLGFPWMSKNGLYGPEVPFVTHTPYVMEALLLLAGQPVLRDKAMEMFHGTWGFLESLKIMYQGKDELALSYAPVDEPRIVVNANSYAAFACALHAIHGREEVREEARRKAALLARWVVRRQRDDGSWYYYADDEPGNFIDCFHSCFVVKNLLKVQKILPELAELSEPAAHKGWCYIRSSMFDEKAGLCRRFAMRAQRDPFRWDLYDQAEFLGLLVDFGDLERGREFARHVERRFRKRNAWYCRIDLFGRRWGRNFLRWGIVPFWYHSARLDRALERE